MEVDNAIVFFSSPPPFSYFFFARTITSFIYLHVLTKSSSAYQININLSYLSFLYYIYVYMKVYLLAGELNIIKRRV